MAEVPVQMGQGSQAEGPGFSQEVSEGSSRPRGDWTDPGLQGS